MKLLIDENISYRILKLLRDDFPDAQHINQIGKPRLDDLEIWQYAKENDLIIVTYDEDFYDIQTMLDYPPKIIWLRFGNARTKKIAEKLILMKSPIERLAQDGDFGILEIH